MEVEQRKRSRRLVCELYGLARFVLSCSLLTALVFVPGEVLAGDGTAGGEDQGIQSEEIPILEGIDQAPASAWPVESGEGPGTASASTLGQVSSIPSPAWPVALDGDKQKVSISPAVSAVPPAKDKTTPSPWPNLGEPPLLVASNPSAPTLEKVAMEAPQQAPVETQQIAALKPEELPEEIPPEPPAAKQNLDLAKVVQLLGEQNKLDPASLSVQEFPTFAVISHVPSNRNWVIARSGKDEGWLLASTTKEEIPTPGSDVCVIEVNQGQVTNQPKLLSELDAPDQPLIAQGAAGGTTATPSTAGAPKAIASAPNQEPIVGPPITVSGFLQFGTSYHTNIYRADEDIDYDLVRHNDEMAEKADVIFQPAIGLRLDLDPRLAENTYFEYIGYADFYNQMSGENRWRHSLEFNTRGESGELLDLWWRGGIIFHDQLSQDEAEYYTQDFIEYWINPGLDFFLTEKDTFTLSTPVFYRDVADDSLPNKSLGLGPDPSDPYNDPVQGGICPKTDIERYADHVGFGVDGTWRRRFSECLETRLRVGYLRRQYDRPALDEYGAIYGCDTTTQTKGIYDDRQDDELETSLGFTYAMNECTGLGVAYRFRINSSNGPYYDYNEHGMRVVANHTIFHGQWCEANLRLVGDVAWRNWDSRRADNMTVTPLPATSGPDGLLTPGYDEDLREDIYYCARLGFDREFGPYTVGTFYQFETNDSNDGSGSYKDHGVGGFVRMDY